MQLTSSQIETFRKIEKALRARKIVLLTGESNGKTTILQEFLTRYSNPKRVAISLSTRPSLNSLVLCCPVHFADACRTRPQQAMKQVLKALGIDCKREHTQIQKAFILTMRQLERRGHLVAVLVDDCELLSSQALSALKIINEIRDPETLRSIGVSVLLSGNRTAYKAFGPNFLDRCVEVNLERLSKEELSDFAKSVSPDRTSRVSQETVEVLSRCQTTLQVKSILERAFEDQEELRLKPTIQSLERHLVKHLTRRAA